MAGNDLDLTGIFDEAFRAKPPQIMPALTYRGQGQAQAALASGRIGLGDLIENTRAELEQQYGAGNVRQLRARGGRFADFEVRQGDRWSSSGAGKVMADLIQAQQTKFMEGVDKTTGASLPARAEASVKLTPEGKYENLLARYGQGNVVPVMGKDGAIENFAVRENESSGYRLLDPPPSGIAETIKDIPGDVADQAGNIAEALPGVVGGIIGSRGGAAGAQVGTIAGDLAGSVARQAASEALPGNDRLTAGERLQSAALNVGAGIAGDVLGLGLREVNRVTSPRRNLGRLLASEKTPGLTGEAERAGAVAARNKQLAEATGVQMTAGQLSGSPSMQALEQTLRQYPSSRNLWFVADSRRLEQLENAVKKTVAATGKDVGAEQAGTTVAGAYAAYKNELIDARDIAARDAFGRARAAAGNEAVIPVPNTLKEIDAVIADNTAAFGSDSATPIMQRLGGDRDKVLAASPDGKISIAELQRSLQINGKAAQGNGRIIKDVDYGTNKQIARRIFAALQRDLEAAAENAATKEAAGALATARQIYRESSQAIAKAEDSILEAAVGLREASQPDKLAAKLLSGSYTDSQVRDAVTKLSKIAPEAAGSMRVAALQEVLEKSAPQAASSASVEGATLSPARFATQAQKNQGRIEALYAGDPQGLAAWNRVVAVAKRIGNTEGMVGSPTAPLTWFYDAFKTFSKSAVGLEGRKAATELAVALNARKLSRILNDPEARDVFFGLAAPKRSLSPQQFKRMAAKLIALTERPDMLLDQVTTEEIASEQPSPIPTPRH